MYVTSYLAHCGVSDKHLRSASGVWHVLDKLCIMPQKISCVEPRTVIISTRNTRCWNLTLFFTYECTISFERRWLSAYYSCKNAVASARALELVAALAKRVWTDGRTHTITTDCTTWEVSMLWSKSIVPTVPGKHRPNRQLQSGKLLGAKACHRLRKACHGLPVVWGYAPNV